MMKQPSESHICGIACSVFQKEIEKMREQAQIRMPFSYLDSALHMEPSELREKLDSAIEKKHRRGMRIVVVYGDCHAYMSECESGKEVIRVRGINCAEIFLGKTLYRDLRRQGAFVFLPEWTSRWHEIFSGHLGLDRKNARSLMGEMHSKLVYIDTGLSPVPHDVLEDITEYIGLPMEVIRVSPGENLLASIRDTTQRMVHP